MGRKKPTRRKRWAVDHVFVERLYIKDHPVRRNAPLSTGLSDAMGNMLRVYHFAIFENLHHLRASQHQRWEVRDPRERCFWQQKQACLAWVGCRSSFIDDPGAKFSCGTRRIFTKNSNQGMGGLWKASRMVNPLEHVRQLRSERIVKE